MKKRIVVIHTNDYPVSLETKDLLIKKLQTSGFVTTDNFTPEAELIISIGGDGATLDTVHEFNFPNVPIVGVNTGHLGFFQEIDADQLDDFIFNFNNGKYSIQSLAAVKAEVTTCDGSKYYHAGINEIVIRGIQSYSSHLNISIGDSFIERFSGDGIIISSPAGSTAYNYSVGGSIVDPRLQLLQVTPIAPMNTTAYRSFTSSILLPISMTLGVTPEKLYDDETYVIFDGLEAKYKNIKEIRIGYETDCIKLIRFEAYDFWSKVKGKFL